MQPETERDCVKGDSVRLGTVLPFGKENAGCTVIHYSDRDKSAKAGNRKNKTGETGAKFAVGHGRPRRGIRYLF